jgi:hypothetical protein
MGILSKISNRHLLVGLVGLGLLNVVLCLMYMMREKSNATEITKLSDDLRLASEKHDNRAKKLAGELALTRVELIQTAEKLDATHGDLEKARTTLATYQDKPWLAESGKTAPWADSLRLLVARLGLVEKTLRDNKLVPSEDREK